MHLRLLLAGILFALLSLGTARADTLVLKHDPAPRQVVVERLDRGADGKFVFTARPLENGMPGAQAFPVKLEWVQSLQFHDPGMAPQPGVGRLARVTDRGQGVNDGITIEGVFAQGASAVVRFSRPGFGTESAPIEALAVLDFVNAVAVTPVPTPAPFLPPPAMATPADPFPPSVPNGAAPDPFGVSSPSQDGGMPTAESGLDEDDEEEFDDEPIGGKVGGVPDMSGMSNAEAISAISSSLSGPWKILYWIGMILCVVGHLWCWGLMWKEGASWGLSQFLNAFCCIGTIVWVIFVAKFWGEAKTSFFIEVAGFVCVITAVVCGMFL